MKIAIMVGSISKGSLNRKVAETLKDRYSDRFEAEILDIGKLPFYDYEIEENAPESVVEMRKQILAADGIIFVTPEYNGSIPAPLKNALDWFSRVEHVLQGKPSLVMGATPGFLGTVNAQRHLREILQSPLIGCIDLPGHSVLIGDAYNKLGDQGLLVDQTTLGFIDAAVEDFIKWIGKIND